MIGSKVTFRTNDMMTILLSRMNDNNTTNYSGYDIKVMTNNDTILLNKDLKEMSIPSMDIFIHNLGQNMHGTLTDTRTITVTYSALDYLMHLGYIPKGNASNPSNIVEFTRLYSDVVFRFDIADNENGGKCYRLIKMV